MFGFYSFGAVPFGGLSADFATAADYPNFIQSPVCAENDLDVIVIDRDVFGGGHAVLLYDTVKKRFQVRHTELTTENWVTLLSFYITHRRATFTFRWSIDGLIYQVRFSGKPSPKWMGTTNALEINVILEEV